MSRRPPENADRGDRPRRRWLRLIARALLVPVGLALLAGLGWGGWILGRDMTDGGDVGAAAMCGLMGLLFVAGGVWLVVQVVREIGLTVNPPKPRRTTEEFIRRLGK